MIPSFSIDPSKLIDKRFKIRKIHYNTYEVDHASLKGQLRLLAAPTNILEVPKDLIPNGEANTTSPVLLIGTQAIVAFTSSIPRGKTRIAGETESRDTKRSDITSFIVEPPNEPWNEFILQGLPPLLLRTKTVLTKLEWLEGFTDVLGGPSLSVNHNTTHSVGEATTGEAGLT